LGKSVYFGRDGEVVTYSTASTFTVNSHPSTACLKVFDFADFIFQKQLTNQKKKREKVIVEIGVLSSQKDPVDKSILDVTALLLILVRQM